MRIRHRAYRSGAIASLCITLGSCAVAANDVEVETMPMRQALDLTRNHPQPDIAHIEVQSRMLPPIAPGTLPAQLVTSPDVRFAYLYERVDEDGNRHFGEWVAIAVSSIRWIMTDGTRTGIEPGQRRINSLRDQR